MKCSLYISAAKACHIPLWRCTAQNYTRSFWPGNVVESYKMLAPQSLPHQSNPLKLRRAKPAAPPPKPTPKPAPPITPAAKKMPPKKAATFGKCKGKALPKATAKVQI